MAFRLMPTAYQQLFRNPAARPYLLNPSHSYLSAVRAVGPRRRVLAVRNMTQVPPRRLEVLAEATLEAASLVGRRLDDVVFELFPNRYSSASGAKKAIRRKEIHVNGAVGRTDLVVSQGDVVQVVVKAGNAAAWPAAEGKPGLDVAYEDDHMACIIKPQGLPTQGKGENTVQGRVKYCLRPSPLPGALFRPHHVHRLDVNTGGLLLVAKTREAGAALARDLAAHNMQKRYLALVLGRLQGSGTIDFPLEGKPAVTLFRAEGHCTSATFGWLTCVSLWPKTGRTHQLRKHCAYIGHPILGDMQYKHHRKPDCQVQQVTDVQQYLPQFHELAGAAAAGDGGARDLSVQAVQQQVQQQQQQQQQPSQQLRPYDTQQNKRQKHQPDEQHAHLPAAAAGGEAEEHAVPCEDQRAEEDMSTRHPSLLAGYSPLDVAAAAAANDEIDDSASSMNSTADEGEEDSSAAADANGSTAAAAAAAAANGSTASSSGGCRQQGQQLKDGTTVRTCLWAVQLQLLHPVTRQLLDLAIKHHAQRLYQHICKVEAPEPPGAAE